MKKQDKVRSGKVTKVDKLDNQQNTGVFQTENLEYRVVHKQDGRNLYMYGFKTFGEAQLAWFQLVRALENVKL